MFGSCTDWWGATAHRGSAGVVHPVRKLQDGADFASQAIQEAKGALERREAVRVA
jgi:hypothetical protein